jgi:alcohol dehydrogenase (cytochrome c)
MASMPRHVRSVGAAWIKLAELANISNRGPAYLDGAIFRGTADGHVIALDAKTGKELWRFYTVPERAVGKTAGGGFWTSFSLNTATGEVLGSAANPAPCYDLTVRPGENLYSNSVLHDAG